jgi:hypothetical protein
MVFEVRGVSFRVAGNVFGLAEVGELEAQKLNSVQKYNRISNAQI